MILLYVLFGIICFGFVFHFATRKWLNPYRLIMIFGKKGCGKSTLLSKIAYENLVKGRTVYSTEPLAFSVFDKKTRKKVTYSTLPITPNRIYNYSFDDGSVVLIDEVNLIWDNRQYKTMSKDVLKWFRLQRHYRVTVYLFSQTFDIDKKLRDLCDDMYICNKVLRVWTIARHVVRKPVIVHPQGDSPASIQDDIVEDGLLLAPFGGMKIAYIPHWARFFDSFKMFEDNHYNPDESLLSQ